MARTTSSTPADFKASICTTRKKRKKNGLIRISLQSYHPKFAPPWSSAGTNNFQAGEKIGHPNPTTALVCLSYISNENQTSMQLRGSHLLWSQCLTPWRPKLQTLKPTHAFQDNPEAIHILKRKRKTLLLLYGNVCKSHTSLHHYSAFCDFRYGSA